MKNREKSWQPYRDGPGENKKKKISPPGLLREGFLLPVRFYQRWISPAIPPRCRFTPTCSCYCVEAVREWGILRGTGLTVWRLLRCQPFSRGGYDPVPRRKRKMKKE